MILPAQVVDEARTWIGTPFLHQARLKGVGCDCSGLVIGIGRALGIFAPDFDYTGYPRIPPRGLLREQLARYLVEVYEAVPGTVALLRLGRDEAHSAIVTDKDTLIHAHALIGKGRVTEHRYASVWKARTAAVFKFRGVAYR